MRVAADTWEIVRALQGAYGGEGLPQPDGYAKGVLADIAKTFGISSSMQPYDLAEYAAFLQPVFSPLRNKINRVRRQGKNFEAKSVTNVDTGNVSGIATEGQLAPAVTTQFADVTTYFTPYGASSDPVTLEQLFAGEGENGDFSIDSRAVAVANLLKAVFLKEERLFLGGVGSNQQIVAINNAPVNGMNFTIGGAVGNAPAGGVLTNAATGGTIPAGTVYAQYCAVTAFAIPAGMPTNAGSVAYGQTQQGQSLPQSAVLSTTTTGSTSTVTFTPPVGPFPPFPIIGWALYLGTASGGPFYYAGFTPGASITVTALPSSGQQPPTTDHSAATGSGPNGLNGSPNGILAWAFGSNSGATVQQLNGALSLAAINGLLSDMFYSGFANPDSLWFSAQDMQSYTPLVVANAGGEPYFFAATQGAAQGRVTEGFRIARKINPVTSKELVVDVHAYLPQGTALALTDQLPDWYIGNNVPDVWSWVGAMDYMELDYQPTAANVQWISEIRCFGGLHCFLPSQQGVLAGISPPS
jgi:hypothetical protein